MDLRVTRIGEERAATVGAPRRGDVTALGVGRQEENVAVAAGGEHHRVARPTLDFAGNQVASENATRVPVDLDDIEHLGARVNISTLPAPI